MTTREQIIAAAKEAGFPEWENTDDPEFLKVIEKLYVVAFQSGAASRDAEVAQLRELLNCYNLGGWTDSARLIKERDQLREQIKMLQEALEKAYTQIEEYRFEISERWKIGGYTE